MAKPSAIADEIVSVIGYAPAKVFFAHFGGKVVTIPFGMRRDGSFVERLIELLGEPAFNALVGRFGGERMAVPKGHAAALIARNRQIVADYDAGARMLELVRRYSLTERQIRSILGRSIA